MGLFSRKKEDAELIGKEMGHSTKDSEQDVSKEKFILDVKTVGHNSLDRFDLPIYNIYQRFQEDWETKGYKDAKDFPETSYRDNQKRVIVDRLRLAIKEALIRYEDKLTDMDWHINQSEKNGLIETLEKYKQERKKLVSHRDELALLDKDAKEIGEKTISILISYDMGFARGMTSLCDESVNRIMNN